MSRVQHLAFRVWVWEAVVEELAKQVEDTEKEKKPLEQADKEEAHVGLAQHALCEEWLIRHL